MKTPGKPPEGIAPPEARYRDDPEHWRARAAEARAIADKMAAPETKAVMLDVAETYDRLAEKAERRRKARD